MNTLARHLITYAPDTIAAVQAAEQSADEILSWPVIMHGDDKFKALCMKYQEQVHTVLTLAIRDINQYRALP
jgi:chloramphenicol O-acetyltransferase